MVRLIVRRVRPTPGSQLALFTAWDYHAFVTDRPGDLLELEADHRRHAIVEQSITQLKSAGLAHLPSVTSWPTPPGSHSRFWRTTSAGPSGSSPEPTWNAPPRRRCAAPCSPSPVARPHRTPPIPAPTRQLALGRRDHHRPHRDHHDPTALHHRPPIPTSRTSEKPADRRDQHAHHQRQPAETTNKINEPQSSRSTADPG